MLRDGPVSAVLALVVACGAAADPVPAEIIARFRERPAAEELVALAPSTSPEEISKLLEADPSESRATAEIRYAETVEHDPHATARNLFPEIFDVSTEASGHVNLLFAVKKTVSGPDSLGNTNAWHASYRVARLSPDGTADVSTIVEGKWLGTAWFASDPTGNPSVFLDLWNDSGATLSGIGPRSGGMFLARRGEDGAWAPPRRLTRSDRRTYRGGDAVWDSEGAIHVATWVDSGDEVVAQYAKLAQDGSVIDEQRLPPADDEPRYLLVRFETDGRPVIVAPRSLPPFDRPFVRYTRSGGKWKGPEFVRDDRELAAIESRPIHGGASVWTNMPGDQRAIETRVIRDGATLAKFASPPALGMRRLAPLREDGDGVVFLGVGEDATYLVRLAPGRADAFPVAGWPARGRVAYSVDAVAVVSGDVVRVFTARAAGDARFEITESTIPMREVAWTSIGEAVWRSTLGRGLGRVELDLLTAAIRDVATEEEKVGNVTRAFDLLAYAVKNLRDAGSSSREIDDLCRRAAANERCVARREQRLSWDCAGDFETRACREWREQKGKRDCDADAGSEDCLHWRYMTREAIGPLLLTALAVVDQELATRGPARRMRDTFLRSAVRTEAARSEAPAWKALADRAKPEDFAVYASLLRDPKPEVRIIALGILWSLDQDRARPFLVGSLTDFGTWVYHPTGFCGTGAGPHTVAESASVLLELASGRPGGLPFRVPLDPVGPFPSIRAQQRWYLEVGPYVGSIGSRRVSYADDRAWGELALSMRIPVIVSEYERGPTARAYAFLEPDQVQPVYRRWSAVKVRFGIRTFGTLPWRLERDVRREPWEMWLEAPDGTILRPRERVEPWSYPPGALEMRPAHYVGDVLQEIGYASMDWNLDLERLFLPKQPGRYRFRLTLTPSSPDEYPFATPLAFSYWDGERFTDTFEFEIQP